MSDITKTALLDAISDDKAEYGYDGMVMGPELTLWTCNEYDIEEPFRNDARYLEALSYLHETTLTEINFENDEDIELVSDPKKFASDIRERFETLVNLSGDLNLKAQLGHYGTDSFYATYYTPEGKEVGAGFLDDGGIEPFLKSHNLVMDYLARGIDELGRECIIEAGNNVHVYGESERYVDDVTINEENAIGNYADLDVGEIKQDIYSSTYINNRDFKCVQEFGDLFKSKNGAKYEDTVLIPGNGNIDSYGTIACDTDIRMGEIEYNQLTMDIKGYDEKTKAELFEATSRVTIHFEGTMEYGNAFLTADDIWPKNVGLMKLEGRDAEKVIEDLPVLCDKRNVEINGDTLRIPMSEATAQIMKEKDMIYGFEPRSKSVTEPSVTTKVKLNEGLVTEKESQTGLNGPDL